MEHELEAKNKKEEGPMTFTMPEHLNSTCGDVCRAKACPEAVKCEASTGRWYITISHPGFNSTANNGLGYATEKDARAANAYFNSPKRRTGWSGNLNPSRMNRCPVCQQKVTEDGLCGCPEGEEPRGFPWRY